VCRTVSIRQVGIGILIGVLAAATAPGASAQGRAGGAARPTESAQREQQKPDDRAGRPGPRKWWQDERSKADLRLTDEQSARIEEIFHSAFTGMRSAYEELRRREEKLSALISAKDSTEAEVSRQADEVEAVRGELGKARVLMTYRMYRVLSPEQRVKLEEMRKSHERPRDTP